MRITASHIIDWVNTHAKEAQANLPRLIRRLCFDPDACRQLSFPAGDSSFVPGWDGVLFSEKGGPWVPAGPSRWEMGCDQDVLSKANGDFRKRLDETSEEEGRASTFVFVTPRRWLKKSDWAEEQRQKGHWADVRAYDAGDLEQWLEQTPAVALQFAEELGLVGPGVMSIARFWDAWSRQCDPAITLDALFMDRANVRETLTGKLQSVVSGSAADQPLAIRADSVEEAAAFAAAVVLDSGNLRDQALVVIEPDGWRYVEANPQLKIAIAARTDVALQPAMRKGLLVIVPYATGDQAPRSLGQEVNLERPSIYEFEKALAAIGMEESDAKRNALSTGRSWTVLRRHRATNPAIRRPAWLDKKESSCLALLCLLGTWNGAKEADRQVVARLAARSYEEVERDLRHLAKLDDAPLLCIGDVWKAKSPLELLSLFGDHITRDQLDRFFQIAREMFSAPDPQLELPDEERWAAQVHGKVLPFSGLMFESICDALMKLAVRGVEQPSLAALRIEERVDGLVRDLLDRADGTRWLSLASHLPSLAEAAPETFLRAVEKSLTQPDAPVTRLITETSDSGMFGRCWHAGLLWALETLAWAPQRLARVAFILASLSHVPMKGNWGNKPGGSLFALFRSWLPQTAASLGDRTAVLDRLIQKDEEAGFAVVEGLLSGGPQTATPAARPKWREDDAGAGHGVVGREHFDMLVAAKQRALRLSVGDPKRIVALLEHTVLRDQPEIGELLALTETFQGSAGNDEDREALRAALREIIHWHRHYSDEPAAEREAWLGDVKEAYDKLAPADPVFRCRWLFDSHWVELPIREHDDDHQARHAALIQARANGLGEVFETLGMAGILRLIEECREPGTVGSSLAGLEWSEVRWPEWIVEHGGDFVSGAQMTWCVRGLLYAIPSPMSGEVLQSVLEIGRTQEWDAAQQACFLTLARPEQETWELAAEQGSDTDQAYWQSVQLFYCRNEEVLPYVIRRLLDAKRPRSALSCCQYSPDRVGAELLFAALQQFIAGNEPDGPMVKSWHLGKMLQALENFGEIERMALMQLEFALFPALSNGQEGKAAALYEGLMSDPRLFAELISMVYKPKHGEREEPVTDAVKATASHAWEVLHDCKRLPATRSDGTIDPAVFSSFVDAARELCRQADRLAVGDVTLGQILAHAPADEDGTWPCLPVRDVLDRGDMEDMRDGFRTGTYNKRGVTTRSPWDGGGQERDLAAYYREQATRVQVTHPMVAGVLEQLAKGYEHEGRREDNEANLRKEGY